MANLSIKTAVRWWSHNLFVVCVAVMMHSVNHVQCATGIAADLVSPLNPVMMIPRMRLTATSRHLLINGASDVLARGAQLVPAVLYIVQLMVDESAGSEALQRIAKHVAHH